MDVKVCDACGRYFSIPTDHSFFVKGLGRVFFQLRYSKDEKNSSGRISRRKIDTCPECSQKIRLYIADNFRANFAEIMRIDFKRHIEESKKMDFKESGKEEKSTTLSEQEDREKKAVWEVEYKDVVSWDDFRDNYYWCTRCKSYQEGQCICYSR